MIHYANKIPIDGLQVLLDPANPKCSSGRRSLINWESWTAGSGGVTGYTSINGSAAEQNRKIANNPWSNMRMVWETVPDGAGEADGGWYTDLVAIDSSKLYRQSVWMRRTSATTGGHFYFGLSTDHASQIRDITTGNAQTNPYWSYVTDLSTLTQNTWYLWVGHVFPWQHAGTIPHPDSGYYTIAGGKLGGHVQGNLNSSDCKFYQATTTLRNRTFHYYCPETTTHLEFYQPRIDLCDGYEPTINDLLNDAGGRLFNLYGDPDNFGHFYGHPKFSLDNGGKVILTAASVDQGIFIPLDLVTHNYTVFGAARYTGGVGVSNRIFSAASNNWLLGHWSDTTENYYAEGWITTPDTGASDTNWRTLAGVGNIIPDDYLIYVNGIAQSVAAPTGGSAGPSSFTLGSYQLGSEFSDCEIGFFAVYNRVLSATEILQLHNAIRGRYSL